MAADGKVVAIGIHIAHHDAYVIKTVDRRILLVTDLHIGIRTKSAGDAKEIRKTDGIFHAVEGTGLDRSQLFGIFQEFGVISIGAVLIVFFNAEQRLLGIQAVQFGDQFLQRVGLDVSPFVTPSSQAASSSSCVSGFGPFHALSPPTVQPKVAHWS